MGQCRRRCWFAASSFELVNARGNRSNRWSPAKRRAGLAEVAWFCAKRSAGLGPAPHHRTARGHILFVNNGARSVSVVSQ